MAVYNVTIPQYEGKPINIGLAQMRSIRGVNDDLFIDCSALDVMEQPADPVLPPPPDVQAPPPADTTATPNQVVTPVNDSLGLPFAWWWGTGEGGNSDSTANQDPDAFTKVTNWDISTALDKCNTKDGGDNVLRAACITSFLANRAVFNENTWTHKWFTSDQGYQAAFFDRVLRAYVGAAAQGKGLKPAIQFYTKDPEGVIRYLKNVFTGQLSEDYIRVVMYWLNRTWGTMVHPFVMEPTEANAKNETQQAKTFQANIDAMNKKAQEDTCTVLGIDWCQVGSVLKWVAILGGVGLIAYIVFEVSSFVPKRN